MTSSTAFPRRLATGHRRNWIFAFLAAIGTAFIPQSHAADEKPLRVQLHWKHQAQFAGYYVAEARAPKRGAAQTFELLEGGPGTDALDRLISGDADVAVGWLAGALRARAKGADLVNVAQIFHRSGMAVACTKTSGVRGAADLAGRPLGVWNASDEISAHLWLQRGRVQESSIRLVQQAADAQDIVAGKIPCGTVMLYNEYPALLRSGMKPSDIRLFRFTDKGLDMLEDGLYVRRASLEDPRFHRRLAAFLKEAAAGWQHARTHRDDAVAAVLAKAPGADRTHQRQMLNAILDLIDPGKPFGRLEPAAYKRTVEILVHDGTDAERIRAAAANGWSHRVWQDSGLGRTRR